MRYNLQLAFDSSFASTSQFTRPVPLPIRPQAAPVSDGGLWPSLTPSCDTLVKVAQLVPCPIHRGTPNNSATSSGLSSKSEESACLKDTTHLGPAVSVQERFNFIPKQVCRKARKMPYTPFLEFCTCILLSKQPQMTWSRPNTQLPPAT